jgi:hypothetical protein
MRPQFVTQLDALMKSIVSKDLVYKEIGGEPISGTILANLATKYVHAISSGQVPTVATAWQAVSSRESENAYASSLEHYDALIQSATDVPKSRAELNALHDTYLRAAVAHFDSKAIGQKAEGLRSTLEKTIADRRGDAHARNSETSAKLCGDLFAHVELATKVSGVADGAAEWVPMDALRNKVLAAVETYKTESKGPMAAEVLITRGVSLTATAVAGSLRAGIDAMARKQQEAEQRLAALEQQKALLQVDLESQKDRQASATEGIEAARRREKTYNGLSSDCRDALGVKRAALAQKEKKVSLLTSRAITERGKLEATQRSLVEEQARLDTLRVSNDLVAMEGKYAAGIEEADKLTARIAHLHGECNKRKGFF